VIRAGAADTRPAANTRRTLRETTWKADFIGNAL
jgi:hypothetical protein